MRYSHHFHGSNGPNLYYLIAIREASNTNFPQLQVTLMSHFRSRVVSCHHLAVSAFLKSCRCCYQDIIRAECLGKMDQNGQNTSKDSDLKMLSTNRFSFTHSCGKNISCRYRGIQNSGTYPKLPWTMEDAPKNDKLYITGGLADHSCGTIVLDKPISL